MRLFVAIVPPEEALDELSAAVDPLRSATPELRWAGREAWHLTLAFLGEVNPDVVPELDDRLGRAAGRHDSKVLAIAGAGAFPSAAKARVLWAGLHGDKRALAALADSVAAGARRAGAPPPDEGRKYKPHLTLARCRQPADVSRLTSALADFTGRQWTGNAIHLIRSHLSGSAPRYEVLAQWPLRAAAPPADKQAGPALRSGVAGPA